MSFGCFSLLATWLSGQAGCEATHSSRTTEYFSRDCLPSSFPLPATYVRKATASPWISPIHLFSPRRRKVEVIGSIVAGERSGSISLSRECLPHPAPNKSGLFYQEKGSVGRLRYDDEKSALKAVFFARLTRKGQSFNC